MFMQRAQGGVCLQRRRIHSDRSCGATRARAIRSFWCGWRRIGDRDADAGAVGQAGPEECGG